MTLEVLVTSARWRTAMQARRVLLRAPTPAQYYESVPVNVDAPSFDSFIPLDWGPPFAFGDEEGAADTDASAADTDAADS